MAGRWRRWTGPLAAAVLLLSAAGLILAQPEPPLPPASGPTGSLAGKLTDLYSKPLKGASLVLRNQATGAEARALTQKSGTYRFTGLEPGEYTLRAESPGLGWSQLEGIAVNPGSEARVQAAMAFEPFAPARAPAPPPLPERPSIELARAPLDENLAPAEPMGMLPLRGQRLVGLRGDAPRTVHSPMNAALAAEPLQALLLTGQDFPSPAELAASAPETATQGMEPPPAGRQGAPAAPEAAQSLIVPPQTPRPALAATEPVAPALTTAVSAAQLQALPASGRRWQEFVLDSAPASTARAGSTAESGSQNSPGGGSSQATEVTVDGASRGLAFGATGGSGQGSSGPGERESVAMAQPWAGGRGLAVSEAAIREVQTVAGRAEAEASRAAGGRMNVATRRGANGLHGQGFLFDRQSAWGARNPFTEWVKETAPGTELTTPTFTPVPYTPPDRENSWGIGLGSHIRRDRLFWFAALDSYARNDPGLATVRNPAVFFGPQKQGLLESLSQRMGPSSNPLGAGVAAYTAMLRTLAALLGPAPRTAAQWTGFARLDWEPAERNHFTLEGIGARWDSPGGGLTRVSQTYGSSSFGSSRASEEWLLGRWETFLTANLLAVTQASAGRTIQQARPEAPSAFEKTLLAGNAWGQLPQIVVDNRYGLTIGNPSRFGAGSFPDEHLYQGQETVDWIRGTLLLKAGFEGRHNADAIGLLRNQTGTYSYSSAVNFASDAWDFKNNVGELNPNDQHNCDKTGAGFGNYPCYAYYSQTIGPSAWRLSTNDWAGFATAQWQARKRLVVSAGLRWEREQLPPPIAALANPGLLLTQKLPTLGNNWGPRVSLAWGSGESRLPVLRLGYGMYFGRTQNGRVLTALTQTGSLKGDLSFFIRPTDGFNSPTSTGAAPPFPSVMTGDPATVIKPGAVEFAPQYRNPEIHQALAAVEQALPGHLLVTASAAASLGRHLPISIDSNLEAPASSGSITYQVCDPSPAATLCSFTGLGPIKATQITVPLYTARLNPDYQQITQIQSRANSTYEAAMFKLVRYGRRGLTLHAHYTYAHAMDWNPNESAQAAGNDVLDPADFAREYGASNLDVRHSAAAMAIYEAPWKLHGLAGALANGWMASAIGQFRSGLPYTMRTAGSIPEKYALSSAGDIQIVAQGVGPGMNGSGGDNRVYGLGNDNRAYNIGRNTFRYPSTWKADLRLGKRFNFGPMRELELLAESFNLFNHQNVTELETTGYSIESGRPLPRLNFLTGLRANTTAFGQPLNINATDSYRERQIQLGLRLRF